MLRNPLSDLGAYFSCDPQNTEIAAGDTVKFEWYAPEYDWSSPSIDSPDEGDDDETAEVTWLYTINQTNEVDDLTNMENGITCGESTPAGIHITQTRLCNMQRFLKTVILRLTFLAHLKR